MPKISIIIPTKNEEKNIGRLLKSIVQDREYNTKVIEIIVVDNPTTTDKTPKICQNFKDVKYKTKGPERSTQRNYGGNIAKGEFLLFLDADMELSKDLLKELLSITHSPNKEIGIIIPERIPGDSLYTKARNIEKQIYDNVESVSAIRMLQQNTFRKIKGFDHKLIAHEDWDFHERAKNTGIEIIKAQSHLKHHEEDIGIVGSIKKKIYYAKVLGQKNTKLKGKGNNPILRYMHLFSRPDLMRANLPAFIYLVFLKSCEFGIGIAAYLFFRLKS